MPSKNRSFSHDAPPDRLGQVPATVGQLSRQNDASQRCWPFHVAMSRGISGPENPSLNPARSISNRPRWLTTKQVRGGRVQPPFSVHNLSYNNNSRRFINHTTTRPRWLIALAGADTDCLVRNDRLGACNGKSPGNRPEYKESQGMYALQQNTAVTCARVVLLVWSYSLAETRQIASFDHSIQQGAAQIAHPQREAR